MARWHPARVQGIGVLGSCGAILRRAVWLDRPDRRSMGLPLLARRV